MPQPWPNSPRARADLAACRGLIRTGSKSFYVASLLLPEAVRAPAYALYAFCRLADDAVDGTWGRRERDPLGAVARLRVRLDRAYAGRPDEVPADRAFADVVQRYAIPRALPEALLEGFEWDATGRRYETLGDVRAYGVRVAGSVGGMMALLMGARDPAQVARACDLGVAMQLTNICRDVGEDARLGRLYLPRTWLRELGLDPDAWLARPSFGPEIAAATARLNEAAEDLYRCAGPGIAGLPAGCRPGIYAARFLYAEIGREVARRGHDSVSARAVVPKSKRPALLARAHWASWADTFAAAVAHRLPPLPEARHLVEAVSLTPPPRPARRPIPWWDLGENIGRALEILDTLEQRESEGRRAPRDAPASTALSNG
jgi:phytoene synthase